MTIADIITHDTQSDIKDGKVEVVISGLTKEKIAKHFDFKVEGDHPYRTVTFNYELFIYNDYHTYDKTKRTPDEEYRTYYHTNIYLPTGGGVCRISYRRLQ